MKNNIILILIISFYTLNFVTSQQVYTTWQQCAYYQNDGYGFECFDEENECINNKNNIASSVPSTGEFYSTTCATAMTSAKTCLESCKSKTNAAEAKTCINACKTGVSEDLVIGYISCWIQCTDNFAQYTKKQPRSAVNADYSLCQTTVGGMCTANLTACTGDCQTNYQLAHKKILQCCLKDGRYNHYTDAWQNQEIVILERCISDFYGANYVDTAIWKQALANFRCYLDCTVMNDNYYKDSTKNNDLINVENNLVNSCSRKLSTATCTLAICNAPAYAASMCLRINRGIYALANPGLELNLATLSSKCIESSTTMTGLFNTDFSNCYKNNELVYSTWDQCAYNQGDKKGYECYDEELECSKTSGQGSTGQFYSSTCATQQATAISCLNNCKGLSPSSAKTCINACQTTSITEDLVIGLISCWSYCTDNYVTYTKRQPESIANADYTSCITTVGGMCTANITACTGTCNTLYQTIQKNVLQCCFKDGRYNHFTDSWSNLEISVLEKCISSYYGSNLATTDDFKKAMNNFRCYLDCTIVNDNYYTTVAKKNDLINLENNLVNSCSVKLQTTCTAQTCAGPAFGASICIRMNRGMYEKSNVGLELNAATLAGKCIDYVSTMPGVFNTAFSNCYKNSECVYSTWDQCAYDQGDSKGYECYDEENECGQSVGSTAYFYSLDCKNQLTTAKSCLANCKGKTPSEAKTCINACKTSSITEDLVIGVINCWSQCTDRFQLYSKRQPLTIANADYSSCLSSTGGMCKNNFTACTGDCNTQYNAAFKKILTCSFKDGRYDHYTDAWSLIEIQILEKCISDYYATLNMTDTIRQAIMNFRCYLDCTIGYNNYFTDVIKNKDLQRTEDCLTNICSSRLRTDCSGNTCVAPAYGSSICIRMNRVIYYKDNIGSEKTKASLADQCIINVPTMTGVFNTAFKDCYINGDCTNSTVLSKDSNLISFSMICLVIFIILSQILI